jgi:tRNA1Val (adenine37-N6)-methyltransferase
MEELATTHDSIYQGKLTLEQPRKAYRFGSDAMLLAAAVHAVDGQKVLELGCGVGAVLLGAHHRLPATHFVGIEREAEYAALAKANVARNEAEQFISIVQGDVTDKALLHLLGTFEHVIANPPYYGENHSGATSDLRRVARQQSDHDLAEWLNAANRFLKPKGTITIIHSVEKMDDLIEGLKKFCGAIRVFPLWPQAGQSCKRIIIHALKSSKTPLSIMPGLVLHEADGKLTERAAAVINHGQSLWEAK